MLFYGFDGWLLNFEADVESAGALAEWVELLRILTLSANPSALIIWYDSVIYTGKVEWQSVLNSNNDLFFQVSDRFFTDYHWKINWPDQSAQYAGARAFDVMTGVDVYGRGTFGGGGYSTYKAIE